jgi:hydrogenase expression/formation protein HypE
LTLRQGKLDSRTMKRVVYRSLGSTSSKVVSGPGIGLDNAVLSIGESRRMLVTTDPVSIIPGVGMRASAWLSVHLIASDYTTSGLRPEFATFTYNMPKEMRVSEVEEYLRAVGRECRQIGVAVVAGHTGSYPGGGFTVVGGGTMFGFCRKGDYVDPTMAQPGDVILMTKGAAIEAAAMLALSAVSTRPSMLPR